jgi:heme exporter protein CcmD
MDFNAAHTGYVIASYALSALCIAGLCLFLFWRDRTLAKKVKTLKNDQVT